MCLPRTATGQRKIITFRLCRNIYSLSKLWVVGLYLPKEQYSRENLILLWRYFCEKYPDKKEYVLQVFVSTEKQSPNDSKVPRKEPRSCGAMIIRQAVGGLPTPGENELMIYCPNLDKPNETKREALAGRDSIP